VIAFRMPSLGADMEAGTLVEWLVRPGEAVKRGDIVAVVETQKGAIEIEIFDAGLIDRLLVEPGTTVPVGTPLAEIRAEGEPSATQAPAAVSAVPSVAAPPAPEPTPPLPPGPTPPPMVVPAPP
jgi:pyruvate dehydrogenase E2 component (dihydrolipoamide acetyltransferase)